MNIRNKIKHIWICLIVPVSIFAQTNYKGKPFQNQPMEVPGIIQCEFFDAGGEGIAYHESDSINQGSGMLNPVNGTTLNSFRITESVDISYTKPNGTDDNPYNVVAPEMGKLYVGWTVPGEWLNYTIKVYKTGSYQIGLMYTANGDGQISFELDNKQLTNNLKIPSTNDAREPLSWRQWHHWNKIENLATVQLKKGMHVLKMITVGNGNMNFDYLDFRLINGKNAE